MGDRSRQSSEFKAKDVYTVNSRIARAMQSPFREGNRGEKRAKEGRGGEKKGGRGKERKML